MFKERIQTTVKYLPSEPRDFGHGPKINIVVEGIADGHKNEYKIYGDAGDETLTTLQKGQVVTIEKRTSKNDKTYYVIVQAEEVKASPEQLQQLRESQELHMQAYANLYRRCWDWVENKSYPDDVAPENAITQRIADSIFHRVVEKLNL